MKAGAKKVYVVVNPTAAVTLPEDADTPLATFVAAYDKVNEGADATKYYPTAATTATRADEVASVKSGSDVILMTGEMAQVNVADGVTEQEAISGLKNQAKLTVERAVARVVVTSKEGAAFEIKGDDPSTPGKETNFVLATLTDLKYTVVQGEQKFNFLKKNNAENGTTIGSEGEKPYEKTPAFAVKTANSDNFWEANTMAAYSNLIEHYDYSGLWLKEKKGFDVKSRTAFLNDANKEKEEIGKVTSHITTGDHGLFLLPTTHQYGKTAETSDYRKSNTAYILVRATLVPKVYVNKQGQFVKDEALKGQDFYLGANGLVYADKSCVQDSTKKGVTGQTARKYVAGKTLYYVWIHPDKLDATLNSPVDRNNIYHVQLSGVASWGANWNALVPYPKNTTPPNFNGPDKPTYPKNPHNPDDRPNDNEFEPKNPPVNPNENITPKETWMAAEVTILPWAVHSYEHILK